MGTRRCLNISNNNHFHNQLVRDGTEYFHSQPKQKTEDISRVIIDQGRFYVEGK